MALTAGTASSVVAVSWGIIFDLLGSVSVASILA
jgi:hypothetical protein